MKATPRVLFATTGDAEIGLGHVVRDIALARLVSHDADVHFALPSEGPGAAMVSEAGFRVRFDGLATAIRQIRPHALVYDRPSSAGAMEPLCDAIRLPVIALDYFHYHDRRVAEFINIKNHGYEGPPLPNVHEGMRYSVVRPEILAYRSAVAAAVSPARSVLVTFGGCDPVGHSDRILALLGQDPVGLSVDVILGRLYAGVEPRDRGFDAFRCERDVSDMGRRLAASDLVFCGAGVTLAEALSLARPVCVAPQNKEEMDLAHDVHTQGACSVLDPRCPSEWPIVVSRARSDSKMRDSMSASAKLLLDGDGAKRIVDIVLRHARGAA